MKGKMLVTIDEELMMTIVKEMMKKSRMARNMKILTLAVIVPQLILLIFLMFMAWYVEGDISFYWFVLLVATVILLWFCVCGYKIAHLNRNKREMKKIQFPVEQNVEFDESVLVVSNGALSYKSLWDNIEVVCETENYWFLGAFSAVIDKRELNPQQFQFVSEKCRIIAAKKKKI